MERATSVLRHGTGLLRGVQAFQAEPSALQSWTPAAPLTVQRCVCPGTHTQVVMAGFTCQTHWPAVQLPPASRVEHTQVLSAGAAHTGLTALLH